MSTPTAPGNEPTLEWCSRCGRDTEHDVHLEIVQESDEGDYAECSREPYRVTTCRLCGRVVKTRMNRQ